MHLEVFELSAACPKDSLASCRGVKDKKGIVVDRALLLWVNRELKWHWNTHQSSSGLLPSRWALRAAEIPSRSAAGHICCLTLLQGTAPFNTTASPARGDHRVSPEAPKLQPWSFERLYCCERSASCSFALQLDYVAFCDPMNFSGTVLVLIFDWMWKCQLPRGAINNVPNWEIINVWKLVCIRCLYFPLTWTDL